MLDFQISVDQSARSLRPWRWEGRFILPTGEEKWIQGASRPELQPNGDILWDGLLMDITDRRRAEEALQQRIFEIAHLHEQIRELASCAWFAYTPRYGLSPSEPVPRRGCDDRGPMPLSVCRRVS